MSDRATHSPDPPARLPGGLIAGAAALVVVVTLVVGAAASRWIDQPFPGFFVLANRVIPSVGLPDWTGSREGTIYQHLVVEVDGVRVHDARAVYAHAAVRAVGTPVEYTLREGATTSTVTVPTARFAPADYWLIFGSYLGTGLLWLLMALAGIWLFPTRHLGRALFAVGSIGGIYALSGAALYGVDGPFRVHALAEACFPAAFVYLALVFPHERTALLRPGVALATWLSLALAIPYVLVLDQPGAYSILHAACETYLGAAGLAFTASLIIHAARWPAAHVLLPPATAGALLGLGVPAVVITLSGLAGGRLPVNIMTATAFLFPLCLGYGLVRDGSRQRRRAPSMTAAPRPTAG